MRSEEPGGVGAQHADAGLADSVDDVLLVLHPGASGLGEAAGADQSCLYSGGCGGAQGLSGDGGRHAQDG